MTWVRKFVGAQPPIQAGTPERCFAVTGFLGSVNTERVNNPSCELLLMPSASSLGPLVYTAATMGIRPSK